MGREELIAALEARRLWAKAQDRKLMVQHAADEKTYEKTIKERARAIAKMTYAEIATAGQRWRSPGQTLRLDEGLDTPRCPISYVTRIDRALRDINLTSQKTFTLSVLPGVYDLLTADPDAKGMCE